MSLRTRASSWPRLLLRRNPRSSFSRQISTLDSSTSTFPRRISGYYSSSFFPVNQTPWISSQRYRFFSSSTMSPSEADRVVRELIAEVEKEKQREREERQRQGLDYKDIDAEDEEDYLGIEPFIEKLKKQNLKDDGELNRREESSDSDSEYDEIDLDEERKKEDIFNKKFQRHKELLQTLTKSETLDEAFRWMNKLDKFEEKHFKLRPEYRVIGELMNRLKVAEGKEKFVLQQKLNRAMRLVEWKEAFDPNNPANYGVIERDNVQGGGEEREGQLASVFVFLIRNCVSSLLLDKKKMEWIQSLPKIELHAHLNGSIRDSTLLELARVLGEKGVIVFADVEHVIQKNDRSLVEVFKLFDLIHKLTTDHKTVTRITREVVEDFALENVVYLELRTTPKRSDSIGMSKRSYMEAVIQGLRSVSEVDIDFVTASDSQKLHNAGDGIGRKKIYVRLLLSIDRRETTESAMETVKLALEMRDVGVVGIDLSGNPLVGEWSTFLPALQYAKDNDLHITLHCGEVPNPKEIQAMLDFKPHRIGHACFFKDEDWTKLKSFRIPVEICLTSNIVTKSISSIDIHHFADLYNAKHPLILCTDDFGVFSTSLSNEYALAVRSLGLSKSETFALARAAIDATFAEDEVKQQLRFIFDSASPEHV